MDVECDGGGDDGDCDEQHGEDEVLGHEGNHERGRRDRL